MKSASPEKVSIKRADELAFLGAAYLLGDRAWVSVAKRGRDWTAGLIPKTKGPPLAAEFRRTYEGQVLRWALARRGKALRAAVLQRAIALADQTVVRADAPQPGLSPEQREEISRLLAEAEADRDKDPLGIRRNWEDLRSP